MGSTSRLCENKWKNDIYHMKYQSVVIEVCGIAELFYGEKQREEWIRIIKNIIKDLEELSYKMIMPHIKKYLKDFMNIAIKAIKGECTKRQLINEKKRALRLINMAYTS